LIVPVDQGSGLDGDNTVPPVRFHDEIVFDSASVAVNWPSCTANESLAAVSVNENATDATTGRSFTAVIDTVNVVLAVWIPSVTVTVWVSVVFVDRALIAEASGVNV
jgi:hypothetical protein